MDMTHVSDVVPNSNTLVVGDEFPMLVGAGVVDPDLIEPREPTQDVEDLIAFRCCL